MKAYNENSNDFFNDFDKFRDFLVNSPNSEDSNLIMFAYIVKYDEDEETDKITKRYELITNITILSPDKQSYTFAQGIKMRVMMAHREAKIITQWIDKDLAEDMVDSIKKGDEDSQFYLDTIIKHNKRK